MYPGRCRSTLLTPPHPPQPHLALQEDRITPSEELRLGRLTQEAIQLQSLYDNLQDTLQREPTDDEWCAAAGKINVEAIRQALEEGMEAKNKLVTSNLRMVQGVVNVYIRNGLSGQYNAGDLMQDGIVVSETMSRSCCLPLPSSHRRKLR